MVNEQNQEQVTTEVEQEVYDLENTEDLKKLEQATESQGTFFRPVSDVTYKIELTDTKISPIVKEFDGKATLKYVLNIKAMDAKANEFIGQWEVGKGVLEKIIKDWKKGNTYKMTKTGSGIDTRYSVVKDF